MRLIPTLAATLIAAASCFGSEWFISPRYSTSFTAETTRDTTATTVEIGDSAAEKDADADRDLDSYGFAAGKQFDNARVYVNYDTFHYSKDADKFADKDVDGWVATANADYIFHVAGPVSLFAGAALTIAGTKPEGMSSDPAPGYGGQIGVLAQIYKTDGYRLFLEAGHRRIYTAIEAEEENNPEVLGALQYQYGQQGLTVTDVKVETETTALINTYFALTLAF